MKGYEPAPPLSDKDAFLPLGERLRRKTVTALGVGALAVSLTAVGAVKTDAYMGDVLRKKNPTTITVTKSPESKLDVGEDKVVIIAFPGFNADPNLLTEQLKPSAEQYADLLTVHYGDDLYPDILADKLEKTLKEHYGDTPPKIIVEGTSLGGIISQAVMGEFAHKTGIVPNAMVLDSSPASIYDVKGSAQQWIVGVLAWADHIGFHGGPGTRLALEATSHISDGYSLPKSLEYGLDHAFPEKPKQNDVVQREAEMLMSADSVLKRSMNYLGDVPVSYISARDPSLDTVVNTVSAPKAWEKRFGSEMKNVYRIGDDHGINETAMYKYAAVIDEFLQEAGIPTILERHQKYVSALAHEKTSVRQD